MRTAWTEARLQAEAGWVQGAAHSWGVAEVCRLVAGLTQYPGAPIGLNDALQVQILACLQGGWPILRQVRRSLKTEACYLL